MANDWSKGNHEEHQYMRRCPACDWIAPWHDGPWDETPYATHCPSCGILVERIACPTCGGPILWKPDGKGGIMRARFCTFCGEQTERKEPRMRTKPAPNVGDLTITKKKDPPTGSGGGPFVIG